MGVAEMEYVWYVREVGNAIILGGRLADIEDEIWENQLR